MNVSGVEKRPITDVRDAIRVAKDYVKYVLEGEYYTSIGLEETEYNLSNDTWRITIGFSRPWDTSAKYQEQIGVQMGYLKPTQRSFKVVEVAPDGTVMGMKNRLE